MVLYYIDDTYTNGQGASNKTKPCCNLTIKPTL